MATTPPFQESQWQLTPIKDLGLTIAGTRLEPILAEFRQELATVGLSRLEPHFYLSTEWGVTTDTISVAIPFYLAKPELTALHAERVGRVEGFTKEDVARYLRHEMGHVLNYAYKLYEEEAWVKLFGSMTQSYVEDYRPEPFSRRYVRHLPGWYGQKHPDEDWAETFAVWLTPGSVWRQEYADWPVALAKLSYCEKVIAGLAQQTPLVTATQTDEDVGQLQYSVRDYYEHLPQEPMEFPKGLEGGLKAIFDDLRTTPTAISESLPAAALLHRIEMEVAENVYRWTGHSPERSRQLLQHLTATAERLQQVYPHSQETAVIVAITTLVTALAMNYVHKGTYLP